MKPLDTMQSMIDNAEQLYTLLPQTIKDIADLIGIEQAMILVEALAGLSYLMPKTLSSNTGRQLVSLIGKQHAKTLAHHFGGEYVYIPLCTNIRRRLKYQAFFNAVMQCMTDGTSQHSAVRQMVQQFNLSERVGYNILKKYSQKRSRDVFDDITI